ncbi:MAG: methionine--tRNA ligase [Candidatus Omnitrophica bacterium]|nr:methionine--tRNA ligase [Candidatus Omnitrophota bacterium]
MNKKFYITTPLYYVNAAPHIGHSYTTIAADTLARYMRLSLGNEFVWFLTGTDEHGQKIQRAADAKGMSAKDFVDQTVLQFKDLWTTLDISYNDFIRTTEKRHIDCVRKVLSILYEKGDIYQDKYEGLYCTPCETFWLESQAPDSLCPDCKRPLERISETNFFFNLGKYQDWLIGYIKKTPGFILPQSRRNEVLSFLEMNKLSPLCISRPKERLSWGIPLPFSSDHVTYVWFDALINYISAVGTFDDQGKYHSDWWPADLHLMAKDILRQHAVYWPIMLYALGLELPKAIFAHGWWLIDNTKMSKSRGNVVNPIDMVNKYSIDVYRYFLLREVPFGLDGNFSEEAIIKRFNSDLANDLGNLLYRTLTMVEKYFQGNVPVAEARSEQGRRIRQKIEALSREVGEALSPKADYNFNLCLEKIWGLISLANKYVEETKPWNLAKENKTEELKAFIRLLVDVLRKTSEVIAPFMPQTAGSIAQQIGEDKIKKGNPLFPRIDTNKPAL